MSAFHELDGLRPVRPPNDLKARVLAAARAVEIERPSWIDRIWESPRVRLAIAGAWLLVLAAHSAERFTPSARIETRPISIDGCFVASHSEPNFLANSLLADLLEAIR